MALDPSTATGLGLGALALSLLCAALFLYPYVLYPRLLAWAPRRAYGPASGRRGGVAGDEPTAALFFCAFNEARALPEKIENLRALKARFPALEIYAYSDCSTDGTNALLTAAADILTPVIGETRTGKAAGMGRMVAMTQAEVLVFTDANVILPPTDLARLVAYFHDPEVGAVSATLRYLHADGAGAASATAEIGKAYWDREERLKRLESETGSMMGADGSAFARRRAGYPAVPPHLLDDFIASFSVLFDGLRCVAADDVNAYERVVASSSDEFRRKRRIACRAFNTYRWLRPRLGALSRFDRWKFWSHKLLRWLGFYVLAAGAVFGVIAALLLLGPLVTGALVAALLAGVAVGVALRLRPVMKGMEILRAIAATALGVVESLRGETYQTWKPAESR